MVYLCAAEALEHNQLDRSRHVSGGIESWNWPTNSMMNVFCYANCPEVTLTLNVQVISTKHASQAINGVLTWQIPYAPGVLRAVGRTNGQEVCAYVLRTAGAPARLKLLPETIQLHADGKDVCQIEFQIVDEQGVRVPEATNEVSFTLTGPGRILGIGNGDLDNSESCQALKHQAYQGRGLAILQAGNRAGGITFQAIAPGLEPAGVYVQSR